MAAQGAAACARRSLTMSGSTTATMTRCFRLVTLGSVALQAKGYTRRGRENVVAPMPPFGGLIPTADELWKILAWVRSAYDGDPKYKFVRRRRRRRRRTSKPRCVLGTTPAADGRGTPFKLLCLCQLCHKDVASPTLPSAEVSVPRPKCSLTI